MQIKKFYYNLTTYNETVIYINITPKSFVSNFWSALQKSYRLKFRHKNLLP